MSEPISAFEGSKRSWFLRKKYALTTVAIVDASNPIGRQIRHINEAMVTWLEQRGTKASELVLTFVAPEALHDSIVDQCAMLISQDFKFAPLIDNLRTTVIFVDNEGNEQRELQLQRAT